MSQWQKVLHYMQSGKRISTYVAFVKFKCTSLRDRIRDCEKHGIYVKRAWKQKGKIRYLEYWI